MNPDEITTEEPTVDEILASLEEKPEVIPPPIINEAPPETPQEVPEEISDEQLTEYAVQLLAKTRPDLYQAYMAKQEEPAPEDPGIPIPDDIYDPDERARYLATQMTAPLVAELEQMKAQLAPMVAQAQQEEFKNQVVQEAAQVASSKGDDSLAGHYQEIFTELGPGLIEAYKNDPKVSRFVDFAAKGLAAESPSMPTEETPLPAKGLGVGGPESGPLDADERKFRDQWNKDFPHLKYEEVYKK